MELLIDNRQDLINIDESIIKEIKEVIIECLNLENKDLNYEVSLSLVNNEEIKTLNNLYRGIDKPTDVLSFPMDNEFEIQDQLSLLGDIVICTEKVIIQSEEYNHSVKRELLYLITHSMFHLLGYDHIEDDDKVIMRDKEKQIIKKIKIFRDC